ncbi:MAG: M23 family metallopeptidase [Verrucomicrobiota bacterium]
MRITTALLCLVLSAASLCADYQDIVNFFQGLNDADTTFPVTGKGYNDIESAFGPRRQVSLGGQYDWHRGIDIDGGSVGDPVGVFDVVAAADGELYDFRTSVRGGYTVILRHEFDQTYTYQGQNLDYYYTWYLHLADDGVGGTFTDDTSDIINDNNWVAIRDNNGPPTMVEQGTKLGLLGDTGSPGQGAVYAPHLHFELRIGSVSSLQFQLENMNTTQWGFDPHVNPMLLFDPLGYGPAVNQYEMSVVLDSLVEPGEDIEVIISTGNDDMPVLNRVEILVQDASTMDEIDSYIMDYDRRIGFDASTNENLDDRDFNLPYIEPLDFLDSDTDFETSLVVPEAWLSEAGLGDEMIITVTDIWGNSSSRTIGLVPEPRNWALLTGLLVLGLLIARRRR